MGTPKQRHTRGRTRRRRSHHALGAVKLVKCSKCNSPVLPHHMCEVCGNYNGKTILTIISKAEKAKAKAKAAKEHNH